MAIFMEEYQMSMSMYSVSVPVFRQILGSLATILEKAEAHVDAKKIEPDALLRARLFPDMFPLLRQVQLATDFAKGAAARLEKTLAFLDSVSREAVDAGAEREVVIGSVASERQFQGQAYLLHYALPNFYFHAATAYDILRHNGLEVGKRDFIGSF